MKFFRILGIFLTLFVVSMAAESCGGKCPKSKSIECAISGFQLGLMRDVDISHFMTVVPDFSLECRKDFGLWIGVYAAPVVAKCNPFNSLFIQSAYALDCIGDICSVKDHIISIQVFSDKDFGEVSAGSDIAEFFRLYEWDKQSLSSKLISFEDYIDLPAPDFSERQISLSCFLTNITIEPGEYEFNFVIGLSDERTFTQSIKTAFFDN